MHYRVNLQGAWNEEANEAFARVTGESPDGAHIRCEDLAPLLDALAPIIGAPCAQGETALVVEVCQ